MVFACTLVSHVCGVKNLTNSAKPLARARGRFLFQTLRCGNGLYRQPLADMSFRIDWQTACGISRYGPLGFAPNLAKS